MENFTTIENSQELASNNLNNIVSINNIEIEDEEDYDFDYDPNEMYYALNKKD